MLENLSSCRYPPRLKMIATVGVAATIFFVLLSLALILTNSPFTPYLLGFEIGAVMFTVFFFVFQVSAAIDKKSVF